MSSNSNQNGESKPVITLRYPRAGEFGWIMQQHGKIYSVEYGFNENCERFVGEIVCDLMKRTDLSRNSGWIAAVDDNPMGCVLCMEESETVARLRFLLVSPEARGLGLGTKLLNACIQFAREAGYAKLVLWTHGVLHDALRLYYKAGFKCASTSKHSLFGPEIEGHELELVL